MVSENDFSLLQQWTGRTAVTEDTITPYPPGALSALLDHDNPELKTGDELLPLWHWIFFPSTDKASELGDDGHLKRGNFLPPVPLPKRMRAGGRINIKEPLLVGDRAKRVSTIRDIVYKEGRRGALVFVTVRLEIMVGSTCRIVEEQDIVYHDISSSRSKNSPPSSHPVPAEPQWSHTVTPDPVLLFRFSALTFNSHRIHYDRDYAMQEEGYPGLVVQAPLVAIMLLDLLHSNVPASAIANIHFRALQPLFDTASFQLQGRRDGSDVLLWAVDATGNAALTAEVKLNE